MYALGVPTTRALSIIGSDGIRRETIETSAVVTHGAKSLSVSGISSTLPQA
jgi:uncharacterized protein YdiU (UPF0061 family)